MNPPSPDPEAFLQFEIAAWEKRAESYHGFWSAVTNRAIDPLLDAAGVGAGTKTLDVASGPGYVTARAAQRRASVIGVDIAERMVALAKRLHAGLDFRQGDVERLPFSKDSFQAVVSGFIVPHLARPERAVLELARVLAPGGRLALATWDVPEKCPILGLVAQAIEEVGAPPPPDLPEGPPMYSLGADEKFSALLRSASLVDVKVKALAFTQHFADPDELWHGVITAGVRTPAYLEGQPPEVRARIRAVYDRLARPYVQNSGFEVPVSIKIASGAKPS